MSVRSSQLTFYERRVRRWWRACLGVLMLTPVLVGVGNGLVQPPTFGAFVLLVIVATLPLLATIGVAVTLVLRRPQGVALLDEREQCRWCGYPLGFSSTRIRCPECGRLALEDDDRVAFTVDMRCRGCGQFQTEMPAGDCCPHCGEGLTFAQAVELSRRARAAGSPR